MEKDKNNEYGFTSIPEDGFKFINCRFALNNFPEDDSITGERLIERSENVNADLKVEVTAELASKFLGIFLGEGIHTEQNDDGTFTHHFIVRDKEHYDVFDDDIVQ